MTLKILCLRCFTLLAIVKHTPNGVTIKNRCRRAEQALPPEAPEERWKWTCPTPQCRRTRELRMARVVAVFDVMRREGRRVAET